MYRPWLPPRDPNARPLSAPELWERACSMFGKMIEAVGGAGRVLWRRMDHWDRVAILDWLEPVEKLVRGVLILNAVTWLLMTPEGRKLMRETPKMALPDPPQQGDANLDVGEATASETAPEDAPAAMAARRESEPDIVSLGSDPGAPSTWRCAFRVFRWTFPENTEYVPPAGSMILGPSGGESSQAETDQVGAETEVAPSSGPPGKALARRIEALSRVIANPAPFIARLAQLIARFPTGSISVSRPGREARRDWQHGFHENQDITRHNERALGILHPRCEPG